MNFSNADYEWRSYQTGQSDVHIIAHCLFEMTFWGFDEATIQEEAQSLNEEALNDSESIPLEDFLKSLRDESPDEESQED